MKKFESKDYKYYHNKSNTLGLISRSEILKDRDHWLHYVTSDGREEFREIEKFGNHHAIFAKNEDYGEVHHDHYNATSLSIWHRQLLRKKD